MYLYQRYPYTEYKKMKYRGLKMTQDRTRRFQIIVTPEALAVLEQERGMIKMSSYITEVLNRYAKEQIRKE